MDPATTISEALYRRFRPLIRQDGAFWGPPQQGKHPDFDSLYVQPPGERVGDEGIQRPSLVDRLVRQLVRDEGDTLTLLTGQKGSGKTFALRKLVEHDKILKRFHCIFVRATGDQDRSGQTGLPSGAADLRLLLLLLAAEISREFRDPSLKYALDLHRTKPELTATLGEWVKLLQPDEVPPPANFYDYAAKINLQVTELSWKMRSDDQRRRALQQDDHFAPSALLKLVGALLIGLRDTIRKVDPEKDLLLIVDDTDKYASPSETESIFLRGTPSLQQLPCKTVITFPYWLHFDPRYTNIAAGVAREVISNIKVVTRDEPSVLLPDARSFFHALYGRLALPSLVASDEVLDAAALLSAGVPREFLRILAQAFEIQEGLDGDAKPLGPVTLQTLRAARDLLARDLFVTAQTDAMRARLKYVHRTRSIPDLSFWQILDTLHIVEYVNSLPWYAVNPLLQGVIAKEAAADEQRLLASGTAASDVEEALKRLWLQQAQPPKAPAGS